MELPQLPRADRLDDDLAGLMKAVLDAKRCHWE